MTVIRYTLEFVRAEPARTVRDQQSTYISVVLPTEQATFEAAVKKAEALLPQGPNWKAPRLQSATESDG